jgi:hypothetical protein
MVCLAKVVVQIFAGIHGRISCQLVESGSNDVFNSITTLHLHDNIPVTNEYSINILPILSFATTIGIVPLMNYSSRFTSPVWFSLVRRPWDDILQYTFTEHSISWALVCMLCTNIETLNLYLPFSQPPPRTQSNVTVIPFNARDLYRANPEHVRILIAVSKVKNISIVRFRVLPNTDRHLVLCFHWDVCDNTGDTVLNRFRSQYSSSTKLFDRGSTYFLFNPVIIKDILVAYLSPYLHILHIVT